jgi:hypothetical protein
MKVWNLLLLLVLCPTIANATTLNFSGENGLTGTLNFDDRVLLTFITDIPGIRQNASHNSPFNTLSGSFGAYTFIGTPQVWIRHYLIRDIDLMDIWLLDAELNSPEANGPIRLNFQIYSNSGGPLPSLIPRAFTYPDAYATYGLTFSFSPYVIALGKLTSLTVEEPVETFAISESSSFESTLLGTVLLIIALWRHWRQIHA